MKYLKYLRYLLRHKWFVLIECFKYGLYWRGLIHDCSKFLPDEFIPYADYFYGKENHMIERKDNNYNKVNNTGDKKFDYAWLLHQKRNKHHWQWWILPETKGSFIKYEITEPYLTEMLCDWIGAGKAQGKTSPKEDPLYTVRNWWNIHKNSIILHDNTLLYFETKFKTKL
jgi:hypothetical protein